MRQGPEDINTAKWRRALVPLDLSRRERDKAEVLALSSALLTLTARSNTTNAAVVSAVATMTFLVLLCVALWSWMYVGPEPVTSGELKQEPAIQSEGIALERDRSRSPRSDSDSL
ncbi:MAG TPA: hypothetical protein VHN20_09225 [Beijerinckiaceae bacterium]|nr:hypothetical protein [Beijerinckiaceae bacterium]